MIPVCLKDSPSNEPLASADCSCDPSGRSKVLKVVTPQAAHSVWNSVTRSTAGTSEIAQPVPSGSILIVDLIVTSDRVSSSSFTVQLNDGTNTKAILTGNNNDAPINLACNMNGSLLGWQNASIELITVGTVTCTVLMTYIKIPPINTFTYEEWLARL